MEAEAAAAAGVAATDLGAAREAPEVSVALEAASGLAEGVS
jgi:hypothetical protein